MAVWTDNYCFVAQCFLYNREKPIAWWMYGPEKDSQFTESVSGIVSISVYLPEELVVSQCGRVVKAKNLKSSDREFESCLPRRNCSGIISMFGCLSK